MALLATLAYITCPKVNQTQNAYASAIVHNNTVVFNVTVPLLNNTPVFIGFSSPAGRTEMLPGDNIPPQTTAPANDDIMYSCFNFSVNPTGGEYWEVSQDFCNYASFIGAFPLNFSEFYHQPLKHFGKIYVRVGAIEDVFPFVIEARIQSDLQLQLTQYGMTVYDPILINNTIHYPVKGAFCNFSSENVSATAPECDAACASENQQHDIYFQLYQMGSNNRELTFSFDVFNCSEDGSVYLPQNVTFNVTEILAVNMLSRQLNPVFINILNQNNFFYFSQDPIVAAYCDDNKFNLAKREFAFGSCSKLAVEFERGWVNITFTYLEFKNPVQYVYQPGDTRVVVWHKGGYVCDALAFELFAYAQQLYWQNSLGLDCQEGQIIVDGVCKDGSIVDGILVGAAAIAAALGVL